MTDTAIINRALELVRDGLRRGAIPAENFNMNQWGYPFATARMIRANDCGTVHCIGGWTQTLLIVAGYTEVARTFRDLANGRYGRLKQLCYPQAVDGDWSKITRKQSANAINRYLKEKEPWGRA